VTEPTGHVEELIAERAARNQSLFREANERIEAATTGLDGREPLPFVCECPETGCTTIVRLTAGEYATVRQDGARFCVAPGHEVREIDGVEVARVVERRGTFTLMEKIGIAGEIARRLDGRRGSGDG
jgi:hypothetical protein